MKRDSRPAISTTMASLALVALIATGGFSMYYAFSTRTAGGLSYTGFTLTLTSTPSQTSVSSGDPIVVIPYGINTNSTLSFTPLNLNVVLGVNSTIIFENQDTTEHILESTAWPSGPNSFDISLIQGKTATVQLNATGLYVYNFEPGAPGTPSPTRENGTITVASP
jgi:hypothetical protein